MKRIELATFMLAIAGIICGVIGYCEDSQWLMDTAWMCLGGCTTTFIMYAWPTHKGD